MSNNEQSTKTERTFRPVNGEMPKGLIRFIKPKELADNNITGVIAEGIYEGTKPSAFQNDNGTVKNDYKIREENDTLVILNNNGSLESQLSKVSIGTYVRVSYNGMRKLTKGKLKGKSVHNFLVEVGD